VAVAVEICPKTNGDAVSNKAKPMISARKFLVEIVLILISLQIN
jgi:hypothetical protein